MTGNIGVASRKPDFGKEIVKNSPRGYNNQIVDSIFHAEREILK